MWEVFPYSRHRDQAVRRMKTLIIIQDYDEYKNVNVMLSVNLTLTSSRNAVGFMLFGVLLKRYFKRYRGVGRIALVQLLQSLKDEIFKILKYF